MTQASKEYIEETLQEFIDTCQASLQHLSHQISLPEKFRVITTPDDVIESEITTLRIGISQASTALKEFKNETKISI